MEKQEIKGNIGEWSEIYTLLKLLGEGKVYAGNENLERIRDLFYPIVMILRQEKEGAYNYLCEKADVVIQTASGEELLRLPSAVFLQQAEALLKSLSCNTEKEGAFPVAKTQAFMDKIHCTSLKAKSTDKTDIRIVLHDQRTGINQEMGFSIKSQIGADSTLLNASKATNFSYRIEGHDFSDEEIEKINAIATRTKIIDRLEAIKTKGAHLVFDHVDNETFSTNLAMLDSGMGLTVSELLLAPFATGEKMLSKLVEEVSERNPLGFEQRRRENIYTYKLKHLLTSVALGMMPSKIWDGKFDANGGYLVVKKDGEILCYHFYDRNRFEDFLFSSAYLDNGGTRRHGYAFLYRAADGKVYFKLNLQIRLK